jgi:hypothetical protein
MFADGNNFDQVKNDVIVRSNKVLSMQPSNLSGGKETKKKELTPKDPGVLLVKTASNQPLLKRRRSVKNWIIF